MENEKKKAAFVIADDVLKKMIEGEPEAKKVLHLLADRKADVFTGMQSLLKALETAEKIDQAELRLLLATMKIQCVKCETMQNQKDEEEED